MATTKPTKKEMFAVVRGIVENVNDGSPEVAEVLAFIDHEVDLLGRKSAKGTKTPAQKENDAIKALILEVLPEDGADGIKVADIATALELSPQKVTALVTQLVKSGDATRVEGKTKREGVTFTL